MNSRSLFFLSLSLCGLCYADSFPEPYNSEADDPIPMPAEEAARTAELPEGFRCEVFAAEPDVQQPIAMCFDEEGALWVAECYTYARQPKRWDLELRDRIIILKDTDGDGKADDRKVFWDKGTRLTSIAVGEDGVWALCSPQLLFIPDADQDGVPDGEPVVKLDGFDAETIGHNVVNGLKWGPDGWLYGRHGITATSVVGAPGLPEEDRTKLNCSIWRYDPKTEEFEVFCHGGTNPWGMDWDANGQLFYTNTVIGHLWHAIPGAYYERMFGAHLNPHVYEIIEHTADHYHWDKGSEKWSDIREGITGNTSTLGGGHAHMGCLIYQGGVWPSEYHGKLFTCNLHGNRINMDIPVRDGCGYTAHHGKDFMMMKDTWFRGLDLITGPDGQMYVNDWCDTGECHDNNGVHRTSGRVYRIVYDGPDKGKPTPSRPEWLTQRPESQEAFDQMLASTDEAKRAMAARWLAEDYPGEDSTLQTLQKLAGSDESGLVRMEVASALQRLPLENRISVASLLASHAEDADDRQQPLLIWYGVSDVVPELPDAAIKLALNAEMPRLRKLIARRLTEDLEKNSQPIQDLLSKADSTKREDILKGMGEALAGWSSAEAPEGWDSVSEEVGENGTEGEKAIVRELSILFGDGRAREELLAIALDQEADSVSRRSAVENLLRDPTEDLLPNLKDWINDKVVSREAVRGVALYDAPGVGPRLLNHWKRNVENRPFVIDTLVSRNRYAGELLAAVEKGQIPRSAILPFQARQIDNLGSEPLKAKLREVWGEIRETPEEKKVELEKWKLILTEDNIASADPVHGKVLFQGLCGACHTLYGEGGKIGPDLTGSDRHNLDYILENTLNPNEVVPADYQMTVFTLKDGRVISGVIPQQNEKTISIQTPADLQVISREEIAKQEKLPVSLMPEGLLQALGEKEVKHLVAYLMSKKP
ncbi:MAG: dehydrogenase [Verrucomicrobiales bacterium]|nr:dehydrogenase [Verrucomicrobiales bacterium]